MDKFNATVIIIITAFFTMLACGLAFNVTLERIDCNYELWLNDNYSYHASCLNHIIENPSDSLVVIDENNPYPIGVIKFERR